jgi:hypothetical protein
MARIAFARVIPFGRFPPGRLHLLGFFQAQQKLILRQSFGTTAEAVTLQFLDDLD